MSAETKELLEERRGLFTCCSAYGNKIIAPLSMKNLLVEIDIFNFKTKYLISFENENLDVKELFSFSLIYKDSLYLLETKGKKLLEYNLLTQKLRYFIIDSNTMAWGNHAEITVFNDMIYIFPRSLEEIIKVDIESGSIIKDNNLCKQLKLKLNLTEKIYFSCGVRINNTMWLFMETKGIVVEFDLEKEYTYIYEITNQSDGIAHASYGFNKIYIVTINNHVICWDMESKKFDELNIGDIFIQSNKMLFSRIIVTRKNLWLLPAWGSEIYIYDFESNCIHKYEDYPKHFFYAAPNDWLKYYGICEINGKFYLSKRSANYILCIDKASGKGKWHKAEIPSGEEELKMYFSNNQKKVIFEEDGNLEHLILNSIYFRENKIENKENVGKKIWDTIILGKANSAD